MRTKLIRHQFIFDTARGQFSVQFTQSTNSDYRFAYSLFFKNEIERGHINAIDTKRTALRIFRTSVLYKK